MNGCRYSHRIFSDLVHFLSSNCYTFDCNRELPMPKRDLKALLKLGQGESRILFWKKFLGKLGGILKKAEFEFSGKS